MPIDSDSYLRLWGVDPELARASDDMSFFSWPDGQHHMLRVNAIMRPANVMLPYEPVCSRKRSFNQQSRDFDCSILSGFSR